MRGFTLVELLIAVGIIGVLSTVAVAATSTIRAQARDARRINDMKALAKALDVYAETYPDFELRACINGTRVFECQAPEGRPNLPIQLAMLRDPSNVANTCSNASQRPCEYAAQRLIGSQKTDDYEFCFYLERSSTMTNASGPHRIETGGTVFAGCNN